MCITTSHVEVLQVVRFLRYVLGGTSTVTALAEDGHLRGAGWVIGVESTLVRAIILKYYSL